MRKNHFVLKISIVLVVMALNTTVKAQQWGDYTLYSVMNSTAAYLIDTTGATYHTWTFPSTAKTGYSSYLLPGGELLRTATRTGNSFSGGPICGKVQKVDWNGTVLWDFVYSTVDYCTHHDIYPMPNGNVLMIAYERKTAAEATAAGSTMAIEIWPDKIVEVQPTGPTTGTVVWEWHAWDHLVQNVNSSLANYRTSIVDHPELININFQTRKDWMHMNGLSYNPMLDQIAFSCHNLNEIYVIDHSTTTAEAASHAGGNSGKGGDILYRWGFPAAYGAVGTQILNVVHDAHWIPEGVPNAGYLVAFNNRGVSTMQSAVDQVSPPVNVYNYSITPGSAFAPTSYTKRHACNGYTSNMGNSQQLPNGNMQVCIATQGTIYEVDSAGTTLWTKTVTGSVAKAFRYTECYVNNPAPDLPTVNDSSGYLVCMSDSAVTYQWYYNGQLMPGETNRLLTPGLNGNYLVRITDAAGCLYRYSPGYKYPAVTAVDEQGIKNTFHVFPNPSSGIIHIDDSNISGRNYVVTVTDMVGKTLLQKNKSESIDLSGYQNGIYYVSIFTDQNETLNSKLILIR